MEIYKHYEKVNKPIARKMYDRGYEILLLPCKVSSSVLTRTPHDYDWILPVTINKYNCDHKVNKFNRTVLQYESYNCNAELGYYAHYYVLEEDYKKFKEEAK